MPRAPTSRQPRRASLILALVALCVPCALAQPELAAFPGGDERSKAAYCVVKQFDFNERPLGNYESTPMYWRRLRGDGLPSYALGELDDAVGHNAPPSFRMSIQTGNVCYEYPQLDLTVVPDCDYFVSGFIRAEQIEHSRAFIVANFVDQFEELIPGSERVSNLVQSAGTTPEPWQRVELMLPGDYPNAYAMRLHVWVLHTYAWEEPGPQTVDPIYRRDAHGKAWFDDITVYRLPRARVSFSHRGNVVPADERPSLLIDVNNATAHPLAALVSVRDADGGEKFSQRVTLTSTRPRAEEKPEPGRKGDGRKKHSEPPARTTAGLTPSLRVPLPALPAGLYTVTLSLLAGDESLLDRKMRFAVMAPLPPLQTFRPDIGVYLPGYRGDDPPAVSALLKELGIRALKLGIPVRPQGVDERQISELRRTTELMRLMSEQGVESTGVLSPADDVEGGGFVALHEWIDRDVHWPEKLSPLLAHFGGSMPSWQIGDESHELRGIDEWSDATIRLLREQLRRFVSVPEIAIPQRMTTPHDTTADITSYWVAPQVPTRSLVTILPDLTAGGSRPRWLYVSDAANIPASLNTADFARRMVLAFAAAPERVFCPAPFELGLESGASTWEPTETFLPLRTLAHYLSGKRLIGAMQPIDDSAVLFFSGGGSSCLVVWTWNDTPSTEPIELYLGGSARAIDLLGRATPLSNNRERTRIFVRPEPIIIETRDTKLALLQSSFRMENTFLQRHQPDPPPLVAFRNPYNEPIAGELLVVPPQSWDVAPRTIPFEVGPGEGFERKLSFIMPPRQIATNQNCEVRMRLFRPQSQELEFAERLSLGLREVEVTADARWDGGELRVEQSLRNRSPDVIGFKGFCDVPGRARLEGMFVNVQPGESSTQVYVYPNAKMLGGSLIYLGVQEIRGERSLNQIVEVPPAAP